MAFLTPRGFATLLGGNPFARFLQEVSPDLRRALNAAVVIDPARPPQWTTFRDPVAEEGEVLVTVSAAALSRLVRAQASGAHYGRTETSSFVVGVDGVGLLDDGRRVYFAFPRSPFGAMAERAPVRSDLFVAVPENGDDVTAAAIANPGMSSWAALVERAKLVKGETVLVNGATGTAGRLAVQIAKYLGAKTVIATGRDEQQLETLRALGADQVISFMLPDKALIEALHATIYGSDVAVILDYLWGVSAERLFAAIAGGGAGAVAPRIRFLQIGAISGSEIPLAASILRSSRLEILGRRTSKRYASSACPRRRRCHAGNRTRETANQYGPEAARIGRDVVE